MFHQSPRSLPEAASGTHFTNLLIMTELTYTDVKLFIDGFFFIGFFNIQISDQRANCDSLEHK